MENWEILPLKMMTLDIDLHHVYTIQGVPINVKAVAQVKIKGDVDHIRRAAEGFLGVPGEQIQATIKETVAGHLRGIIGTLTVEELYRDQKRFQERVREEAHQDLEGMGFEFKSFVFREIQDDEGYLNALGQPKIQEALKNARIATALADGDAREALQELLADLLPERSGEEEPGREERPQAAPPREDRGAEEAGPEKPPVMARETAGPEPAPSAGPLPEEESPPPTRVRRESRGSAGGTSTGKEIPSSTPTPSADLMQQLPSRLARITSLSRRLGELRRALPPDTPLSLEEVRRVLELFPPGWARRRALTTLLERGSPASFEEVVELIRSQSSSPIQLLLLAGAVGRCDRWAAEEKEQLAGLAPNPTLARRLRQRLSPKEKGSPWVP